MPNVIAGRYLTLTRDEIKKYAREVSPDPIYNLILDCPSPSK